MKKEKKSCEFIGKLKFKVNGKSMTVKTIYNTKKIGFNNHRKIMAAIREQKSFSGTSLMEFRDDDCYPLSEREKERLKKKALKVDIKYEKE